MASCFRVENELLSLVLDIMLIERKSSGSSIFLAHTYMFMCRKKTAISTFKRFIEITLD